MDYWFYPNLVVFGHDKPILMFFIHNIVYDRTIQKRMNILGTLIHIDVYTTKITKA